MRERRTVSSGSGNAGDGRRIERWHRWASVSLLVVSSLIFVYVLVSSIGISRMASHAAASARTSDYYEEAAYALVSEESLERKYRLEPSPEVAASHQAAAESFEAALMKTHSEEVASDRALVERILGDHRRYVKASRDLFLAVARHRPDTALKIDRQEVDPVAAGIEQAVIAASDRHHAIALAELSRMRARGLLLGTLTPIVFVVGLVLLGLSYSTLRGYRRRLLDSYSKAVHDSLHDALTGLPNRALLMDRLDQALRVARRDGTHVGVLLVNLNHFKEVNDTFGHGFGDLVLAQVGPRMRSVLRDVDTMARFGGDEFVVLLPGITRDEAALEVAMRLRAASELPFRVESADLILESSIGVSVSGIHGDDPGTLLQRADVAMYVAKDRNIGVFTYDAGSDDHGPERLTLLAEVHRALDERELVLYYQPKVSLATGDVCGAEALVRWRHPEKGLLSPAAFLPSVEQTGLVSSLARYVIDAALAQARRWADEGRPLPVSVNLSARNLLETRLPADVADALRRHGVPASLLELEVTESAIMTEPARALGLLVDLRSLGVGLSIDDFGAGSTCLSHLANLPVTELKIDRSFVMPMADDENAARIVASVVDLAHNLGLATVAEGVEDAVVLDALSELGCDAAQGFFLAHPMSSEDFEAWHAAHVTRATALTGAGRRVTQVEVVSTQAQI